MTAEEIKPKIYSVVLSILPNTTEDQIADDSDIFALGLDSVNAMNLIFQLQDEFGVQFDMGEINLDNFRTVANIEELLKSKQSA
ncbi:D-alanine--poly(phosphoribitol) ligase subunit 2 [Acaryochloris thomasi RCC1774]|uniref:D-alanine--poly(Phosphoribitol) ligase subunit 2 n=1 Tax=Acaryochloris thomasi RCC1774 TaxID=1764569 RepID=A0A2W1JU87_9CYAN|nr:acyl carrier protein [Acaryochloris thomasi]PZD73364.1 D-alanine--poly(phosphoribitol) ligase subunit 2 [Acaryochloris thomasi RCC1774]